MAFAGVACFGLASAVHAQTDVACFLAQQGTRIVGMKERCATRFRITELGEGALRGVAKLGNAGCAKQEVTTILFEVVELSEGKNLSFDDQWLLWCENQHSKFIRLDAQYFTRR